MGGKLIRKPSRSLWPPLPIVDQSSQSFESSNPRTKTKWLKPQHFIDFWHQTHILMIIQELNEDQLEQLYGCMSRATFGVLDPGYLRMAFNIFQQKRDVWCRMPTIIHGPVFVKKRYIKLYLKARSNYTCTGVCWFTIAILAFVSHRFMLAHEGPVAL